MSQLTDGFKMYELEKSRAHQNEQVQSDAPSMYFDVMKFYDVMQFGRPARPTKLTIARRNTFMAYVLSEVLEFGAAVNLEHQVDAAVDLLYFIMDIFVELGVNPQIPFNIVHEANMAKCWPDGSAHFDHSVTPPRMLKPDGWQPPEDKICNYLKQLLEKTYA